MNVTLNGKYLFFFGLAAFVVVGFVAFLIYRQQVFSNQILSLQILGTQEADMGQEVQYTVEYKNNGNFVLESPKLQFELPDNSLTEDSKLLFDQNLKNINPGDEEIVVFKARLFGKEGDVKTARAALSYAPHNLSARYESDASFDTKIGSVPIDLTYTMPSEASAGTELDYTLNYSSLVDYPLENMSLKISPTPGFKVTSSSPKSLDNIEWKLPTINKSDSGQVKIKGMIDPAAQSPLTFSVQLGMWQNGTFIVTKDATETVTLNNAGVPVVQPAANVAITQKVSYVGQDGFAGSGPIPPQTGQPTTYVLNWQVKSSNGAAQNVVVKAALPQNVTIGDDVVPDDQAQNISLDTQSRQLTWSPGSLEAEASASVTFQITVTPDILDKGTFAQLIGTATVTARDESTGIAISSLAQAVDTSLPDDRSSSGGGVVQ